ncbi:MAG TPA: hypothetical protein VNI36_07875 [Candidatus Dormibacteraeota bacterium]|nr:hypothetical protein [Candidatus Dormibacteraeota bacterium]
MADFRTTRTPRIPGRAAHTAEKATSANSSEKRRGVRVNSQVPVAVEWDVGGEPRRGEAQTRVVGPYGCLVLLPQSLELRQPIRLTNLVSKQSNSAVVVWRGHERTEGWELGIELTNPQMDFWGFEL